MPATLKLTHKAIGAEARRGTYDVVVDGERVGSVEMNHTIAARSPGRGQGPWPGRSWGRACRAGRTAPAARPGTRAASWRVHGLINEYRRAA
jgi:hypothetical protein